MRLEMLREALSNLLRQRDEWEDGYFIFQLVVEGADPSLLATERGISQAVLVEQLRDAVDLFAAAYEDVANKSLGPRREEWVRPAPARKRR